MLRDRSRLSKEADSKAKSSPHQKIKKQK